MTKQFENASELIFFTPRSQYRWNYEIDGGKKHIILQDDMAEFIKQYIDKKEMSTLSDIMMRHQPFIISVPDRTLTELHKVDDTLNDQRQTLRTEIDNVLKRDIKNNENKSDNGDESFKQMIQKFIKF